MKEKLTDLTKVTKKYQFYHFPIIAIFHSIQIDLFFNLAVYFLFRIVLMLFLLLQGVSI